MLSNSPPIKRGFFSGKFFSFEPSPRPLPFLNYDIFIKENNMRTINDYKKRFNILIESKMGDVKPLISEAPQFEEFVVPTLDMVTNTHAWSEPIPSHPNRAFFYKDEKSVMLKHELSLSGNEYKITLPEGMYDAGEEIKVTFFEILPLKLTNEVVNKNIDYVNLVYTDSEYGPNVNLRFLIPNTQKEFEENSPFIKYGEFRCKNVKGGKIRFSVEVPSGSEIFEIEKPVPTPTPNNNYKPVPTPTPNENYKPNY